MKTNNIAGSNGLLSLSVGNWKLGNDGNFSSSVKGLKLKRVLLGGKTSRRHAVTTTEDGMTTGLIVQSKILLWN